MKISLNPPSKSKKKVVKQFFEVFPSIYYNFLPSSKIFQMTPLYNILGIISLTLTLTLTNKKKAESKFQARNQNFIEGSNTGNGFFAYRPFGLRNLQAILSFTFRLSLSLSKFLFSLPMSIFAKWGWSRASWEKVCHFFPSSCLCSVDSSPFSSIPISIMEFTSISCLVSPQDLSPLLGCVLD